MKKRPGLAHYQYLEQERRFERQVGEAIDEIVLDQVVLLPMLLFQQGL